MEKLQLLHQGCVSSVLCTGDLTNGHQEKKVVKAYHKASGLQARHWLNISREVAILDKLKELRVPGVVQLCSTAEDASALYLVFEACTGGDLYRRLAHCGLLNEAQLCKEVMIPLLKVLHSLHQLGIIHRDIKPENIFFDAGGCLVLGDFGLAINKTTDRPTSRVGTLDYMAPEVLAQPRPDMVALRRLRPFQLPSYDTKVDIWALGVLVYESLMGITPFGHTDPETASLQAQFRRPAPLRPGVSAACADFVARVLAKQAVQRPTALQLLGHPWVQGCMSPDEAAAYRSSAQQWFSNDCSIQRLTSCPSFAAAAPTCNNTNSSSTASNSPVKPAAAVNTQPSPCGKASDVKASLCKASPSPAGKAETMLQLSQHMQQPFKQQQQSEHSPLLQQSWQRLVQKHRQQQQARQQQSQHGTPQAAPSPAAAAGGAGSDVATRSFLPRSSSAVLEKGVGAVFCEPTLMQAKAVIPQVASTSSIAALPYPVELPIGIPAAAASRGQAMGSGGSSSSVPRATAVLSSSVPASPVTDKASASYWLLSPQQPRPKQHNKGSSGSQPATVAGWPVYAAAAMQVQQQPAAAGGGSTAATVAAGDRERRAANAQHMAASPLQVPLLVLTQCPDWSAAAAANGCSPSALKSPLPTPPNRTCFQVLNPCSNSSSSQAASLVRAGSAGLTAMPPLPAGAVGAGQSRPPIRGTAARSILQDHQQPQRPQQQQQKLQCVFTPQAKQLSCIPSCSSTCRSGSSTCTSPSSSDASSPADVGVSIIERDSDCCAAGGPTPEDQRVGLKIGKAAAVPAAAAAAATDALVIKSSTAAAADGCGDDGVDAHALCDSGLSSKGRLLVAATASTAAAAAAAAAAKVANPSAPANSSAAACTTSPAAAAGVSAERLAAAGGMANSSSLKSAVMMASGQVECCSTLPAAAPLITQQALIPQIKPSPGTNPKAPKQGLWSKVQGVCQLVASKQKPLSS